MKITLQTGPLDRRGRQVQEQGEDRGGTRGVQARLQQGSFPRRGEGGGEGGGGGVLAPAGKTGPPSPLPRAAGARGAGAPAPHLMEREEKPFPVS